MRKIYILYAVACIGLTLGCSNSGAFTDEEKKAQDSLDKASQDQGFNDLEKGKGDTSMRKTVENPEGPDPKMNGKPDANGRVPAAGDVKPYVAPEKIKAGQPPPGQLPGPPIQERK